VTDINDETFEMLTSKIERRSALKKVAVGGAIAWTAPLLLTSQASAVDLLDGGCTAKCAPGDTIIARGSVRLDGCAVNAPGQDDVSAVVLSLVFDSGSCGCGGDPVITGATSTIEVGSEIILGAQPGNNPLTAAAEVTVSCTDRSGNIIERTCDGLLVTSSVSGNCNSLEGTVVSFVATIECGPPSCSVPS
jgi:hypothetical protein